MSESTVVRDEPAESEPRARIKPIVFFGSGVAIVAVALWALLVPTQAANAIGDLVVWASEWFGWFYIALATGILVFVLYLAVSKYGRTKLGPSHSVPEYSTFAWAAMLFAAGIGTDLMFFAVAEPVTQYLQPPVGQGGTEDAAREATVWTLFHYGINGWGMYALMGMALAYFSYRMNLPLAVRSALYPIIGKRIEGPIGHGVDIAAVLGTIFGVATSLGIGVAMLNVGLDELFGIPLGEAAQVGLIVLAVVIATISAVTGVDRGIKFLSQLNVLLAIGLALFILVTGRTIFLLNGLVQNVGDFVSGFPRLTMETFAFDQPVAWMQAWTLFFWAWWIAWAAFVGLFLARISRGRTIRQFVAGTMIIPFSYILMWVSIFGNSAIDLVRGGNTAFGEDTVASPELGLWTMLQQYPLFPLVGSLALFVGLLFYVTSADSAALVLANLSSRLRTAQDDANRSVRIFWAVATGLLTAAILLVGDNGIVALQNATIIMGLPFAFVLVLVMYGLWKALRVEAYMQDSHASSLPARFSGRRGVVPHQLDHPDWRQRLGRAMAFPDRARVAEFLADTVQPALQEVSAELRDQGVEAQVSRGTADGEDYVELVADVHDDHPFHYRVCPREVDVPAYGRGAMPSAQDSYCRLEVHLREGGQGYDVMGYTHTQLIDDVLDQYERHLEFLRIQEAGVV
jgi:choline/glycine/proline betaine transport protein